MRLLPLILTLSTVVLPLASQPLWASDPFEGTWDIDAHASQYNPGPARKNEWRTYRADGKTIHMVGRVTLEDGTSGTIEYRELMTARTTPLRATLESTRLPR